MTKKEYDVWLDWATRTVASDVIQHGFSGLRGTLMWVTNVYAQMAKEKPKGKK
jgi:hypothetical protein